MPSVSSVYFSCWISHIICETLADDFLHKKRERVEDAVLKIMAMNIYWRSSRTVSLCKAVSEIHFASGWLCPLLAELCRSDSKGPGVGAEQRHITEQWWWTMNVDTLPPVFEVLRLHVRFASRAWSVGQCVASVQCLVPSRGAIS